MVQNIGTSILTGVTAFTASNLDDIVVLMLFFAQVKPNFQPRHIIAGQYLGFTALLLASLPGFFGGLVVPREGLGLLGFLPIGIGLFHLRVLREVSIREVSIRETSASIQTVHNALLSPPKSPIAAILASLLNPYTYQVAAVTIANGGDNLGLYLPLFANQTVIGLVLILFVFYVMVGVWCVIAAGLTRHRIIADFITNYGDRVVPFVLMGLGVFILMDSGTLQSLLNLHF